MSHHRHVLNKCLHKYKRYKWTKSYIQWNYLINATSLNSGHFSNVDSAYYPSYIEMCTKLPLNSGHLSNVDSAYYPSYIEMCTKLPLK